VKACKVDYAVSTDEFDALEDDWTRLCKLSPSYGLFNSWQWNRLWWSHYGELGSLQIIVVRIDNIIQGIAPFYCCSTRVLRLGTVRTLRFIGFGGDTSPDDLDILVNPVYRTLVGNTLIQRVFRQSDCTRLQLTDIPENSFFLTSVRNNCGAYGWTLTSERFQRRQVGVLPKSIESYEKGLSRNSRKQRKRRRRRLSQAGQFEFSQCKSSTEVDAAFEQLASLHKQRQASKGKRGGFHSAQYNKFQRCLMHQSLQRHELWLVILRLNDQTVGIEYAFLHERVLLFFQTGFDPAFEHLSPGHLMVMELIDQAILCGAEKVDFLKGYYDYKDSYADKHQVSVDLELWKNPLLAAIIRPLRKVQAYLKSYASDDAK
jgi:CelD/BcsL family acetyltransferase involved in cellulose biosynthesis